MAGAKTKERDRGFKHILKQMRIAEDARVTIGFRGDKKGPDGGATLVEIATYNEYGTTNEEGQTVIPARPFLSANHDEKRKKYQKELKGRFSDVLRGSTVEEELGQFGEKVVGDVKVFMTKLDTPPNAESTKAAKKGVDNPLIDTGTLRNAVTKKVEL
jgi:hypothetical protein